MVVKFGIVMDCISTINIAKDSTFAMLLEAQKRGWEIHYMETSDMFLDHGVAMADTKVITVLKLKNHHYEIKSANTMQMSELDVVLMRKDPPFNMEYIYATYILDRAELAGTLIVNKPQSLRDCNEKLYTAWFPDLTPATLVTSKAVKIKAFRQQHGDIIIKPLDGMGGASIFLVKKNDPNINVIIETLTQHGNAYTMVQSYVRDITDGDKRILIVNGEPIPYCLARVPADGETRGNLNAGARGEPRPLTESDLRIANAVGPVLKAKGLLFVGLDVIGEKLTEINVTSPTGICQIDGAYDTGIAGKLLDAIEGLLGAKLTSHHIKSL